MGYSRRSRSQSSRKNSRTFKSGRVTRNPFLNFMRDFRKSNGGMKVTELTRRGAEMWRKMNDRQKSPYCHLARQAPRRRNRKRRRRRKSKKRRRMGSKSRSRTRDGDRRRDYGGNRYERDQGRCEAVEIRVKDPDEQCDQNETIEIVD